MNENIDLTENRDFRKINIPSAGIGKNKTVKIKKNFIDIAYCISCDSDKDSGAVAQGDKHRRTFIKETSNYGEYCERCGAINRLPWQRFGGLCPKCDRELAPDTVRELWIS